MNSFTITPDTPFSLQAAGSFGSARTRAGPSRTAQ
jgi:hypothetical protein